jgi:hypothetical protein
MGGHLRTDSGPLYHRLFLLLDIPVLLKIVILVALFRYEIVILVALFRYEIVILVALFLQRLGMAVDLSAPRAHSNFF